MCRVALRAIILSVVSTGLACEGDVDKQTPGLQSSDAGVEADAQPELDPDLQPYPYQLSFDAAPPLEPDLGEEPDTAPASPCQYDEVFFEGGCYSAPGLKWMSFETAEQICGTRNAEVASITSLEMNDVIFGMLPSINQQAWIGLQRVNGAFAWTDGQPMGFENWASGEPNNEGGNEACAVMWGPNLTSYPEFQSRWNDTACDTNVDTVICRRDP